MLTTKSTDPNCFIRLFDKSKRSSEISGAKAFHGTDSRALLGKPANDYRAACQEYPRIF